MNKMVFKILITLCLIFSNTCYSQEGNVSDYNFKNKYLRKIIVPTKETKAHLFYLSYGYGYSVMNKTFNTNSTQFSIGLNLSRLFTHKMFFGITYSHNSSYFGFLSQNFSNNFISNFNSNYKSIQPNIDDSASALTLKRAVNNKNDYGTAGNAFDVIGLTFSPYPDRFGGMILNAYYGTAYIGFYGIQNILPFPESYSNLTSLRMKDYLRIELDFTPYYFFNNKFVLFDDLNSSNLYSLIKIGVFFERLSLEGAEFDRKPLTNFVDKPFINKYKLDYHFGFKLSLSII